MYRLVLSPLVCLAVAMAGSTVRAQTRVPAYRVDGNQLTVDAEVASLAGKSAAQAVPLSGTPLIDFKVMAASRRGDPVVWELPAGHYTLAALGYADDPENPARIERVFSITIGKPGSDNERPARPAAPPGTPPSLAQQLLAELKKSHQPKVDQRRLESVRYQAGSGLYLTVHGPAGAILESPDRLELTLTSAFHPPDDKVFYAGTLFLIEQLAGSDGFQDAIRWLLPIYDEWNAGKPTATGKHERDLSSSSRVRTGIEPAPGGGMQLRHEFTGLAQPPVSEPSESWGKTRPLRAWTSRDGKHKTEARFVSAAFGKVTLENRSGERIEVPIDRLSGADQSYIESLR